jgi:hypothetical protein
MTLDKRHFREAKEIISDSARLKLEGRIYPAIKSCVRNRYLIISGYLAYAGFLVSNPAIKQRIYGNLLREIFVPLVFLAFVIHNLFNYSSNNNEQAILEGAPPKSWIDGNRMEVASALISLVIFIVGFFLLKDP